MLSFSVIKWSILNNQKKKNFFFLRDHARFDYFPQMQASFQRLQVLKRTPLPSSITILAWCVNWMKYEWSHELGFSIIMGVLTFGIWYINLLTWIVRCRPLYFLDCLARHLILWQLWYQITLQFMTDRFGLSNGSFSQRIVVVII